MRRILPFLIAILIPTVGSAQEKERLTVLVETSSVSMKSRFDQYPEISVSGRDSRSMATKLSIELRPSDRLAVSFDTLVNSDLVGSSDVPGDPKRPGISPPYQYQAQLGELQGRILYRLLAGIEGSAGYASFGLNESVISKVDTPAGEIASSTKDRFKGIVLGARKQIRVSRTLLILDGSVYPHLNRSRGYQQAWESHNWGRELFGGSGRTSAKGASLSFRGEVALSKNLHLAGNWAYRKVRTKEGNFLVKIVSFPVGESSTWLSLGGGVGIRF
jgi:hypothetical protein